MFRTFVASCLLLMCNAVFAQSFTVDNIKYEVLDGGNEVAIAGFEDETQTTLAPPEKVSFEGQEYTVTAVAESAFGDQFEWESWQGYEVILPNTITEIYPGAFMNCANLKSVKFPEGLLRIGESAFLGCVKLKQIVLPESMEQIYQHAFNGCTTLSDVKFPKRISWIWSNAFKNCTSLTEVVLPDSIDSRLDSYMFEGCTQLQSITLPSYFKTSSSMACNAQAFTRCGGLKYLIHRAPEPLRGFQYLSRSKIDGVSVIVPNGCLAAYSADTYWKNWPLYEMDQYTLNIVTIPNKLDQLSSIIKVGTDFADHGLLTSPSQISTNKLEPTEGSIEALLDNDKETYFHSTWSVANESLDNYHFLEVDLGKTVKEFTLNYARRSHGTVSSPRVIHVYAANDPNGDWKDMGTYTCELTFYCFTDEDWEEVKHTSALLGYSFNGSTTAVSMDDKYRYVRLVVEETYTGPTDNNIYFTLSELAIFETFDGYKVDLSRFLTDEECSQLSNDITQITEASATFGGTDQMVNTLDAWINRIQEGIATGVDQVTVKPTTASKGVYSISGKLVKTQSDNLNDLPKGVYIVNGKKVVK